MTPSSFGYSICFVALFAAIGLIVGSHSKAVRSAPLSSEMSRLYGEVDTAFAAKEYDKAVPAIQELLRRLPPNVNARRELLYYNLGLANILGGKNAEAEAGFRQYLKWFPKGEFASRCYLGIGRAAIDQRTHEKNKVAIKALKVAALDPKCRAEASLWLGQLYMEMGKPDDASAVFKSLIGLNVRTPQQTTTAVEVITPLAENGDLADLIKYLDRLNNQQGIRNAYAWYASQMIVRADALMRAKSYDAALAIYRTVPMRNEILTVQTASLLTQLDEVKFLEAKVEAEMTKSPEKRHSAFVEMLDNLKPAIEVAEKSLAAIEEKADFDAAILMRRGRAHYYLDRREEALVCFRAIRNQHPDSADARAAAYAEIIIFNKLQDLRKVRNNSELIKLCEEYLKKYPDAANTEEAATLAGELLVQTGDWFKVGKFYRELEAKFPNSGNLDRYVFFQGVAHFMDANFKESVPIFSRYIKDFPDYLLIEKALYYLAMSHFLANNYKETLKVIKAYIERFPEGEFVGDLIYRQAFVDFTDKGIDQSDNIIKNLTSFLNKHPDDASAGSMYCLLADTYKDKKTDKQEELDKFQKLALEAYKKAIWAENPDDVVQYALDSATRILSGNEDYAGIAALNTEFIRRKPDSALIISSVSSIVKMKAREGKSAEASEIIANALKPHIAKPASEHVEFLIDELVKAIVPRKKSSEIDLDALDKQLVDVLNTAFVGQVNATTTARINYAQARLAQMLKREDIADTYIKSIAIRNTQDLLVLSPALLSLCGDLLLKSGDLDGAEAMFKYIVDHWKASDFSDAGPVGLGYVALARKKPAEALEIFEKALNGTSRYKEASLGKLQALADLERDEDAKKFALELITDKMILGDFVGKSRKSVKRESLPDDKIFRGEFAAKAYMILAEILRRQASKAPDEKTNKELLGQAHGYLQRVYVSYLSMPEVAAEGYWQAYETALELKDDNLAMNTLKALAAHPKLKNTERAKKAVGMLPN